jgi:hypothetical protein
MICIEALCQYCGEPIASLEQRIPAMLPQGHSKRSALTPLIPRPDMPCSAEEMNENIIERYK